MHTHANIHILWPFYSSNRRRADGDNCRNAYDVAKRARARLEANGHLNNYTKIFKQVDAKCILNVGAQVTFNWFIGK